MIKRIREWIPVEITSGSSLLVFLLVISSVSCSAVHYASDGDEFSSIMDEERGLERIMDRNEAYRIRERMLHNFTRELGINLAASEEADSSEQILRRMLKMDLKNPNTKANMELLRSRILQTQGPMHSRSADLMIDRRRWFFGDHKKCYSGKCEFFLLCWLSGGLVESGCGGFMFACCVRPRSGGHLQAATAYSDSGEYSLQKAYGPVINDPVCGQPNAQTANRRIVGGEESGFGSFPWQAYIRIGTSRCGGSLVNHHYVITAGHCVARSTPDKIRITLGEYTLNSDVEPFPSTVVGVSQINVHPNFKFTPQADRYDVAVLRLSRPVPYQPHISPICLPDKGDDFDGDYAWAAGWGAMQAGSKIRPKTLQAVDVPIIDNTQCERWHKSKGINVVIHEEMVCAGYRYGGKDSCQGDSGGPLMLEDGGRWTLVGIVSAGFSCAQAGQPGIYHRVSATTDWISSVAWS